mgnify:CR=1 FL=1
MNINVMRYLFFSEHGEINISNNLYKFFDDGLVTLYGFLGNSSNLLSVKISSRTKSQTLIRSSTALTWTPYLLARVVWRSPR